MVDYKRLGERIAQTRKSQKLSQEKLAELADITDIKVKRGCDTILQV